MVPTFFCAVAGGMLIALHLARVEAVAFRFVRVVGLIGFALSASIGVWSVLRPATDHASLFRISSALTIIAALADMVVVLSAPLMNSSIARPRVATLVGGLCGMAAAAGWSMSLFPAHGGLWVWNVVGQMFGSFLLGSVTVAWLLGHAYLTATTMTIAPLRRLSRMFSLAVTLRWAYLAAAIGVMYWLSPPTQSSAMLGKLTSLWLIVSLRVAVGLLAAAAFAYMVGDCVKLRSTQSATGILYFASVFVYIGELCSQHLMTELGLPI